MVMYTLSEALFHLGNARTARRKAEAEADRLRADLARLREECAAALELARASLKLRDTPMEVDNSTAAWVGAEREWREAVDAYRRTLTPPTEGGEWWAATCDKCGHVAVRDWRGFLTNCPVGGCLGMLRDHRPATPPTEED